jgi:hypothetical protein
MKTGAPCRRSTGTLRAYFDTQEAAERFASDPRNWPAYQDDVARLCKACGYWHLNRPEWLAEPGDILHINDVPHRLLMRRSDGGTLWEKLTPEEAEKPAPDWLLRTRSEAPSRTS